MIKLKVRMEIETSLELLAAQLAELDDDAQAQVICQVAAYLAKIGEPAAIFNQGWAIGRHLVGCECSTPEGRDFVHAIYQGMVHSR